MRTGRTGNCSRWSASPIARARSPSRTTTRCRRAGPTRPRVSTGWTRPLARLQTGQLMQQMPPSPGAGLAQPTWKFPDPKIFLEVLRKIPLVDVTQCLRNSDDADPAKVQILQMSGGTFDGISQPGVSQPDPNKPATITLPTTKYIGMAVMDSPDGAVGLGFGTYDTANARVAAEGHRAAGRADRLLGLHGHRDDHPGLRLPARTGGHRVPRGRARRASGRAGDPDVREPSDHPRSGRFGRGHARLALAGIRSAPASSPIAAVRMRSSTCHGHTPRAGSSPISCRTRSRRTVSPTRASGPA